MPRLLPLFCSALHLFLPDCSHWLRRLNAPIGQEGMKLSDTYYLVDMSTDGALAAVGFGVCLCDSVCVCVFCVI